MFASKKSVVEKAREKLAINEENMKKEQNNTQLNDCKGLMKKLKYCIEDFSPSDIRNSSVSRALKIDYSTNLSKCYEFNEYISKEKDLKFKLDIDKHCVNPYVSINYNIKNSEVTITKI